MEEDARRGDPGGGPGVSQGTGEKAQGADAEGAVAEGGVVLRETWAGRWRRDGQGNVGCPHGLKDAEPGPARVQGGQKGVDCGQLAGWGCNVDTGRRWSGTGGGEARGRGRARRHCGPGGGEKRPEVEDGQQDRGRRGDERREHGPPGNRPGTISAAAAAATVG